LLLLIFYWVAIRPYQTTDNAYVQANSISVAAQISGQVLKTYVVNNQYVKAGDLLFEIDPEPFQLQVNNMHAQLELTKYYVDKLTAAVDQAQALLEQRIAELQLAQINDRRVTRLVALKALTPEDGDTATSKLKQAAAAVDAAQAQLEENRFALGKLGSENDLIKSVTSLLEKAELNLSYTKVVATESGQISNCTIYPGQYVTSGQTLFALISDRKFWVDANFKETQLKKMQTGQNATIEIDMYPGKIFHGIVESISGASGTTFSLLPPQNATGNWVKVTQRVPVRIIITDVDLSKYPLRLGTSAAVKIRIKK
jgi:membrane fusion protein (multidrug efflux system)